MMEGIVTLPNGIQIVIHPDPLSNTTSVYGLVCTGSKDDPINKVGIRHYLEHMLFKGTPTYTDRLTLKRPITRRRGSINGTTFAGKTQYEINVLSNSELRQALHTLGEILFRSLLRPSDFDIERGVIYQEVKKDLNMPDKRMLTHIRGKLFPNSSLTHLPKGDLESVQGITHHDITDVYTRFYTTANTLIVIAGSVPEGALEIAEEVLGGLKVNIGTDFRYLSPCPVWANRDRVQVTDSVFGHTRCVLNGYYRMPNKRTSVILTLWRLMLAGDATCPLFQEVREKRALCYGVQLTSDFLVPGIWNYRIVSDCGAENTNQFIDVVWETIKMSLTDLEVFAYGKDLYRADIERYRRYSSIRAVQLIDAHLNKRKWFTDDELLGMVNSITHDELVSVIEKYYCREETFEFIFSR